MVGVSVTGVVMLLELLESEEVDGVVGLGSVVLVGDELFGSGRAGGLYRFQKTTPAAMQMPKVMEMSEIQKNFVRDIEERISICVREGDAGEIVGENLGPVPAGISGERERAVSTDADHMVAGRLESGGVEGGVFTMGVGDGLAPGVEGGAPGFLEAPRPAIGPRTIGRKGDVRSMLGDATQCVLGSHFDIGVTRLPVVAVVNLIGGSGDDRESFACVGGAVVDLPEAVGSEGGGHSTIVVDISCAGDFPYAPNIVLEWESIDHPEVFGGIRIADGNLTTKLVIARPGLEDVKNHISTIAISRLECDFLIDEGVGEAVEYFEITTVAIGNASDGGGRNSGKAITAAVEYDVVFVGADLEGGRNTVAL